MGPEEVIKEANALPHAYKCRVKPNRTWAKRFMYKFGIDRWSCNTAGTYLDGAHPNMVVYRTKWKHQQEAARVSLALRMNYDQMWKNRYRAPKRKTRKQRGMLGKARPERKTDLRYLPKKGWLKRKIDESKSAASDGHSAKVQKTMGEMRVST